MPLACACKAFSKAVVKLPVSAIARAAGASGFVSKDWDADDVAKAVVQAVKAERFYILTHPRIRGAIAARMEEMLPNTPRFSMWSGNSTSNSPSSASMTLTLACDVRPLS